MGDLIDLSQGDILAKARAMGPDDVGVLADGHMVVIEGGVAQSAPEHMVKGRYHHAIPDGEGHPRFFFDRSHTDNPPEPTPDGIAVIKSNKPGPQSVVMGACVIHDVGVSELTPGNRGPGLSPVAPSSDVRLQADPASRINRLNGRIMPPNTGLAGHTPGK